LCTGKVPGGWCNSADPYIGFEGAFKCLVEAGDVAFLKHTTVQEMVSSKLYRGRSTDEFELLCKNGQRMPVSEYLQCNWGMVPTNALVVSSARSIADRRHFQRFLESAMKHHSHKVSTNYSATFNQNDRFNDRNRDSRYEDRFNRFSSTERNDRNPFGFTTTTANPFNDTVLYESFEMFESSRYGRRLNLLFQVNYFTDNIK
jgi:melanoma-associated antigen p97